MSLIQVVQGSIVDLNVEAIVNAANEELIAGLGVCGAIHKVAGPELQKECLQKAPCPTGTSVLTHGYKLKARYVIQTVGPIYPQNPQAAPTLLQSSYLSCLKLATENKIKSLAFPCISTGVYAYPKNEAAKIAIETVKNYLVHHDLQVTFCCFENEDYEIYQSLLIF